MKLSELRPCDNCGGPLATGSYAVDMSVLIVSPTAAREVVGLTTMFNGALGLAGPELAAAVGYEYSGGFRNALSNLRTAGLLVGRNQDALTVSEHLVS